MTFKNYNYVMKLNKEVKDMPILLDEDMKINLPNMIKIEQKFNSFKLEDVESTVRSQFARKEIKSKIFPGQRIAIAVGSRGISNLFTIVKTIVEEVKNLKAEPFIVSAMGSHGKGTESGQREVLNQYGISEENLGVKIITKTDVEKVGCTSKGIDVYFDKEAMLADMVIPVNRIKLHTDFLGELQSGLCKMLVIGLGNQKGCSTIHESEPIDFSETIEEAAQIIIDNFNVGFGIGIIENAFHETVLIEAVQRECFITREKELVQISKKYMPEIMISEIDILIVEEIGKDISGAGFDTNILGRSPIKDKYIVKIPKIKRMILLGLSKGTHGNGVGIGMFDIVLKDVFNNLDFETMYANVIAAKLIEEARIPIMVTNEDEAIKVAIKSIRNIDKNNLKIVKIKNTLDLEVIEVSEAYLEYIRKHEKLDVYDK